MSFTAIDGYAVVCDLLVGSDGSSQGIPELSVGSSPFDEQTARMTWDPDMSDGFDSGWVHMEVDVNAAGGAQGVQFSVGGVTISYATPSFDEILGFILRAGVDTVGGSVVFRNITGEFFQAGSTRPDQVITTGDDGASTDGGIIKATQSEGLAVVAPDGGGFKEAKVFADVRLKANHIVGPTDLFGQVFVFAT